MIANGVNDPIDPTLPIPNCVSSISHIPCPNETVRLMRRAGDISLSPLLGPTVYGSGRLLMKKLFGESCSGFQKYSWFRHQANSLSRPQNSSSASRRRG